MASTRTAKRMTFKEAVKECAQLGFTLIHDREWGEFIVKPRGALKDDVRNHHTGGTSPEDLEDAVNTCRAMSQEKTSARGNKMATRRAKLDMMTGFSGVEKIDGDQGAKGSGYFAKWTTVGLPDQGRNDALDDDQQKTSSGAPETSFPGNPLKVPMEAEDVKRPKIREGREAAMRKLQRVASEIRYLDPPLARRIMAASEELAYDDLSTAALDVSGDEANDVDDHQDGGGHGKLQFFGTDAPRSTSLTRKSSRRVRANPCKVVQRGDSWILIDDHGDKVGPSYDDKETAEKAKLKFVKRETESEGAERVEDRAGTLEFASRRSSRRRAEAKQPSKVDMSNSLKLVEETLNNNSYDREAVGRIFESDYKRISDLLRGNQTTPQAAAEPHVRNGDNAPATTATATAGRRRKARAQGDAPLKPEAANPDDDGPGADGAGGFAHKSKAPLQTSMNADDVKRPRIRENPEASKSLWAAFKHNITKRGDVGGTWNDGRYTISSRDYGNTLEITASVKDREGIHMPMGSMTISLLNDSPTGRFASVELNDGLVENRVLEFTMKPKMAAKVASWIFQQTEDASKETLEHMGVS